MINAIVRFIEEILAPSLVRSSKITHYLAIDVQRKPAWATKQVHPRLFRRSIALAMITTLAACDQIIPRRIASARARVNMIERQFRRRVMLAAILAGRVIAQQNVFSRERAPLKRDVY